MMDTKVRGKTKFTALAYRAFSPNFGRPLAPPQIPGPLLEAETGDTIVVNFRNEIGHAGDDAPARDLLHVTTWTAPTRASTPTPAASSRTHRTFQYVWEARAGTEGAWLYHDHGPMDPVPVFKGLFGPLIIRKPGAPRARPRVLPRVPLASRRSATGLDNSFSCINGRAYAGNTPTLRAKVGQTGRLPRVRARQRLPHLPPARAPLDRPETGRSIDNKTIGPADSFTLEFVEDNPGRWFYHCHVFPHLHMGMNGWYIVSA